MCPPSFLTGLKPSQEIRDGSRLELKVAVKGDPDPQVTWTKDGAPISSSEIMEVKYKNGTASVIIAEVFPEDAGKFTCRATNSKGSVETSSKITILPQDKRSQHSAAALTNGSTATATTSVSALPTNKSPQILDHIKSRRVADGDAVTLTASIGGCGPSSSGGDNFDVVWLHNEKEIKPSKDFEYKSQAGGVYSLVIHEVFPEDAGAYTCEAFNDVGECFTSCSLDVEVPGEEVFAPKFTRYPVSLTVKRSAAASFEAEVDGSPTNVIWMKDGREIKQQEMKYRLTASGCKLGLDILECSTSDAGQYALIVTSKKGEAKAAFSLNI